MMQATSRISQFPGVLTLGHQGQGEGLAMGHASSNPVQSLAHGGTPQGKPLLSGVRIHVESSRRFPETKAPGACHLLLRCLCRLQASASCSSGSASPAASRRCAGVREDYYLHPTLDPRFSGEGGKLWARIRADHIPATEEHTFGMLSVTVLPPVVSKTP